jgi:hypothetical protein
MKTKFENEVILEEETSEGFFKGATIAVILLFLLFIGASFYIAISSYMEAA